MVLKLLLLLPALAIAKIHVELVGTLERDLHLNYSGYASNVISDSEMSAFMLNDPIVKLVSESVYGRRADSAYLRNPTPWGDIYQTYGLPQVRRMVVPIGISFLKVDFDKKVVMQKIFENNSSIPATFDLRLSQSQQNTMNTSWIKTQALTIKEDTFDFELDVAHIGGRTYMNLPLSYGSSSQRSETVNFDSKSHLDVLLQPGQSVLAVLNVTTVNMRIEVTYKANLTGMVMLNYDPPLNGHKFLNVSVETVMKNATLSNSLLSTQLIDISLFTNSSLAVYDRKLNSMMLNVGMNCVSD